MPPTENEWLLQDILRVRWGFQGFVVSDWGAINDRIAAVNAGLSLEMPGSGDFHRNQIIDAVRTGRIPPVKLDEVAVPLLAVILKGKALHRPGVTFDPGEHDALARRAAGQSMILLKNDGGLLPLDPAGLRTVALIGAFAKTPRYQGAGSSQVNPTRISTAYEELVKLMGKDTDVRYAAGYTEEGERTSELLDHARQQAKDADVAVVFAGLPDSYESEGFDRASLDLPPGHNDLIEAVAAVQPNVVVVLMNGSAVTMPWVEKVGGIVEAWLGGQAGGGAVADVLTGRVNPSGKLAETFPARLEDTPAYPDFPAREKNALYGERCFIGYRYYDVRKLAPLFPFGFGLSYTTFAYSDLRVSASTIKDTDGVTVEARVKNTGKLAGKEVVQLYVREQQPKVARPEKELKAFAKVALGPGEETTVRFRLEKRDFAYYDAPIHDWAVNSGKFELLVGGSSRDLALRQTIEVEATEQVYPRLTRDSLLKEFAAHPKGKPFYPQLANAFGLGNPDEPTDNAANLTPEEAAAKNKAERAVKAFLDDMPAKKVSAFSEGKFTTRMLDDILRQVQ